MRFPGVDVVITGLGPVSSIGVGVEAFWRALCDGRVGATPRSLPVDLGRMVELPLASMPEAQHVEGLKRHSTFLSDQECGAARDLAFALLGMELALADASLEFDRDNNRIGLVQAFEAPGVERTVGALFELMGAAGASAGAPPVYDLLSPYFYNMQPFVYVHLAAKAFGLRGFCTSVHHACSSGAFAIELAAQCIRAGHADAMLVAGGEAFDTAVRLEWFRRLDLYARGPVVRPFDRSPTGFFVGEGAGALVMESSHRASQRNARPYARYLGGAFAHQGWKQTVPDVRAARLRGVIRDCFERTGVGAAQVDFVVPHGAATGLSDQYEASCLAAALEGASSRAVAAVFKPFFGHLLASSGLIDTIAALLCLRHQEVPAAPNRGESVSILPIPWAAKGHGPLRTALKLSTGFTGHDAALMFHSAE